jgi:hypothetical protein
VGEESIGELAHADLEIEQSGVTVAMHFANLCGEGPHEGKCRAKILVVRLHDVRNECVQSARGSSLRSALRIAIACASSSTKAVQSMPFCALASAILMFPRQQKSMRWRWNTGAHSE